MHISEIFQKVKIFILNVLKKERSQLLTNMLIVTGVSIFVKGITFYKEILVAKEYGISELLDTFLIAVLVPSFIQNVFINSYGSVFIPNYLLEKSIAKDTRSFQTSSFIITITIALIMMVVTFFCIDFYLESLFPGHTKAYYNLIKIQLWIILPCMLFWAISSLISSLLMVDNKFLSSSLNSVFTPLALVFCLFFQDVLQEKTLALGMLLGSILSTTYLIFVSIKKQLLKLGMPDFKSKNMKTLINQIPAKISSGLINGVNPIVDQFFSAQMAIGAIAALNYGVKIPMVTISLMSLPLGSVILPYFSTKAAENRKSTYLYLQKILKSSFLITAAITVILILLSKFIITMFFERGEFNSNDTDLVYVIQQMYFIQLPFYVAGIIMNKYLTAINKNNFLVFSSLSSFLLNIFLNYTLIEIMGIKGLALATSLVSLINAMVIYLYIKKQHSKIVYV